MLNINTGWAPITEPEKQLKAPVVEKDAGVEAIFWRVHVVDEVNSDGIERAFYHYVRLKVFNDKGKEQAATIDIPFDKDTSILHVAGRTIKADGTIVELNKEAITERDLVRARGLRRRVKSFAMPAVEPGSIVEYRWQEVHHKLDAFYIRLQMQREFPVQKVTYFVKPLPSEVSAGYRMALWPFNCKPSKMDLDRQGFSFTSLENVPAFKEEPMMPAEANVRPWLLVFYHNRDKRVPEEYWDDIGKQIYRQLKQTVKLSNELKHAASKAVEGVKEEEKIAALIRYMRANLRGLFDSTVTDAERLKLIKNMPKDRMRNSAEVFESGIGTPDELNTVFAAMATHVGLDARPVRVADRGDLMFQPSMADSYFLRNTDMAVKQGDTWRVFDVSAHHLPANMLTWREAGMAVLISDPKKPTFIMTPASTPDESLTKRTARLTLSTDGTLSGAIREEYTGHSAYEKRLAFVGQAEAKVLEQLKEEVTRAFPKADVKDLAMKNIDDPEKPLTLTFTINAPQFAQRTGKRMFFQPLVFQRGDSPLFESTERLHAIHFRYAWKESDEVYIRLPDGYELDGAENPGGLDFGEPGKYELHMNLLERNTLQCKRSLTFGNNSVLVFSQQVYPMLKKVFDEVHRRDTRTIALKQAATAGL
jgi:hypothetical protein